MGGGSYFFQNEYAYYAGAGSFWGSSIFLETLHATLLQGGTAQEPSQCEVCHLTDGVPP